MSKQISGTNGKDGIYGPFGTIRYEGALRSAYRFDDTHSEYHIEILSLRE